MKTWGLVDLYLLRNELGRYKIGISSDVNQRVRTISLAGGLHVEVVKIWTPIAACHVEDVVHSYFKDNRHLGEWFELNSSPEAIIDKIVIEELKLCREHDCTNIANRKDVKYRTVIKGLNEKFNRRTK